MKHYFYLLSIFVVLVSCKNHSYDQNDNIQVIDFKQNSNINLPEIIETAFIKLETNDSCLIGNHIAQIEATQGKIFILTGGSNVSLFVFDSSGKFDSSIGGRGTGPGEYIAPVSFSMDYYRNLISVVDLAQKKIINYSLDNYLFLSEKRMEYDSFCFEYFEQDKMVWKNASYEGSLSDYNFIITDINYQRLGTHIKRNFKTGYNTGPLKNVYKSNGQIYAYTQYDPLVYHFMDYDMLPAYHLKFDNHLLPSKEYLERISENNTNFLSELNRSDYISYYCVFESSNILSVYYSVSQVPYMGIYDKENRQAYRYSKEEFQDKMKVGEIYRPAGIINDYIVAFLQPYDLLEKKIDGYVFSDMLQSIVAESHEEDNPILFLFKIK
jgi:hypothetical protein